MIESGDRVLLLAEGRDYYVRAGEGTLQTDLGTIDLSRLIGREPGSTIASHRGVLFTLRAPRATDFFAHASRSGAPMLPRDIGYVIAATGMNRRDAVLDAGTGSGIAAIYFGGIARSVETYEQRTEFAAIAEANIRDAKLENVRVVAEDVLTARGEYDVIHLDLSVRREHIEHAYHHLRPGGYLACYTPFIEQMSLVLDVSAGLFPEVHAHECIDREMTRTARGTRPSTRVGHSGYITIARR
ncbi:MAG: rRNA adenine N-6-methyltransferase family protein [Methanomicrobiales archaeon]|nr:rRNA adenine N-6-methyltransferase family protein [Methanomicrobiales archaeon]MDI6877049.1 rRNA adenine N-6-methyltransferase family protein [Methanomicrobiales archaeon]